MNAPYQLNPSVRLRLRVLRVRLISLSQRVNLDAVFIRVQLNCIAQSRRSCKLLRLRFRVKRFAPTPSTLG
jgi:hypothetical protein